MSDTRLGSVSLDCTDPAPLAEFWAALLDGEIAFRSEAFWAVRLPGGMFLSMVTVPDHAPPTWPSAGPDGAVPKQFHLDVSVTDLDSVQARAVSLGARASAVQENPERFRVMFDPAGHPFCLTVGIPD